MHVLLNQAPVRWFWTQPSWLIAAIIRWVPRRLVNLVGTRRHGNMDEPSGAQHDLIQAWILPQVLET